MKVEEEPIWNPRYDQALRKLNSIRELTKEAYSNEIWNDKQLVIDYLEFIYREAT